MTKEFVITDDKIKCMSQSFGVDDKTVRLVHGIFGRVMGEIKYQYLAHIIRAMESYLRNKTGNPLFQINCFPLASSSPKLGVGCAQYYPKRYFTIFFHPDMDEMQLRVCLAHELGHLFIIELLNEENCDGQLDAKTLTEPLSSIFGVFTIMDKNDSYDDRRKLNHGSWEDIVDDFILLQTRQKKLHPTVSHEESQ